MITLYGHPYSHNSRKVHWALTELELEHRFELVDLMVGAQKASAFLAMNPNGRVPVLDDDGFVVFESNAILQHVSLVRADGRLMPESHRSQVAQWLFWQSADLADAMLQPWLMKFYASTGAPFDAKAHAERVESAHIPLRILDACVRSEGIVGEQFTIADISLAESVGLAEGADIDLSAYPNTRQWFDSVTSRPAYNKTRPAQ